MKILCATFALPLCLVSLLTVGPSPRADAAPGVVTGASLGAAPVVGATSMEGLALSVSTLSAPAAGVHVYVAPPVDPLALTQSAANASTTGGIVLVAPITFDVAEFKSTLSQWSVGTVRLVGRPASFPQAFVDGLKTAYSVDTTRVSADTVG